MGIAEIQTSFPLIKNSETQNEILTPKISLRFNPGDMKDYNSSDRSLNVDSIFDINISDDYLIFLTLSLLMFSLIFGLFASFVGIRKALND